MPNLRPWIRRHRWRRSRPDPKIGSALQTSQSSANAFPFLELSGELRNKIYHYYLAFIPRSCCSHPEKPDCTSCFHEYGTRRHTISLFTVNRQINWEAKSLFWWEYGDLFNNKSFESLSQLRSVSLCLKQYGKGTAQEMVCSLELMDLDAFKKTCTKQTQLRSTCDKLIKHGDPSRNNAPKSRKRENRAINLTTNLFWPLLNSIGAALGRDTITWILVHCAEVEGLWSWNDGTYELLYRCLRTRLCRTTWEVYDQPESFVISGPLYALDWEKIHLASVRESGRTRGKLVSRCKAVVEDIERYFGKIGDAEGRRYLGPVQDLI